MGRKEYTKDYYEKLMCELMLKLEPLKNDTNKYVYFNNDRYRVLVDNDCSISKPKITCKNGYVELSIVKMVNRISKSQSLARYILKITEKGLVADHINRNVLDNRKFNLREVSRKINAINHSRCNLNYRFKGVKKMNKGYLLEIHGHYITYNIRINGGETEEDCAKIYDCISLKINGNFHVTNFEKKDYTSDVIDKYYNQYFPLHWVKDRSYRKKPKSINQPL